MKRIKDNYHYIVSALAVVGIVFAAVSFSNPPLFSNLDNFVLFASENLELEKGVQVSSGDLGSNNKLDIDKDSMITGNLFADKIEIDKNTTVNGNISFNKLEAHKDAKILGAKTTPVSLPIANPPTIPDFQPGTQDFTFQGPNNTLAQGSYQNITLEKQSRLILSGGIYNLSRLNLKANSTLIYDTATVPETTVIDNFETEALGNLFGQNGWVLNLAATPNFTVQNTVFNQGRQAVKGQCLAPCPTNRVIGKALPTPITNTKDFTTLSFDLRVDTGLAVVPVTNTQFTTAFFAAFNASTGNIFLAARPKSVILARGAPSAIWHHLDVHIDLENQRVQARVNNGPWSPFLSFSQAFIGLNNVHLRVGSDLSPTLTATTAYFDNLQITVQKPLPTTIVNIQKELKGQDHIAILPANNNLKPTDLIINYQGKKEENEKDKETQPDKEPRIGENQEPAGDSNENEIGKRLGVPEDQEKDDCPVKPQGFFSRIKDLLGFKQLPEVDDQKCAKAAEFGQNSFLNFKLLAPRAEVHIEENSTLRGQVLARKVRVGKGSILSSDITLSLQPKPEDIVSTIEGARFVVNQIILQLTPDGTFSDANAMANSIGGRIVGNIPSINLYQIAVSTRTIDDLDVLVQQLLSQHNPKIKVVSKNIMTNLIE